MRQTASTLGEQPKDGRKKMKGFRRARIALMGTLTGAALFAAGPSTANAGLLVQSAPSCDNSVLSQPFAQFGDDNNYFLAHGGDFESGASEWADGGARVIGDQEPWQVAGAGGHALNIPAGHSVVSPTECVGIEDPSMRFFAHRSGGGLLAGASQLLVTARVETSLGIVIELPVGTLTTLTNAAKWNKTPTQYVVPSLLPLLPGEHTPIQFRYTAVGTSDWVIDDVFVDPHGRA
jgi:hypothetical protein